METKKRKISTCSSDSLPDLKPVPGPPNSSDEKEKRILYICLRTRTTGDEDVFRYWFGLDLNLMGYEIQANNKLKEEKPSFSMPANYPHSFSSVALGSKIYVFGGFDVSERWQNDRMIPVSKVSVLDTNALEPVWEDLPDLKAPKIKPGVVAVDDDQIYVIGSGHFRPWTAPWCEVFYPKTGECQPRHSDLPPVILDHNHAAVSCALVKERGLIVTNLMRPGGTLLFDWTKNHWSNTVSLNRTHCFYAVRPTSMVAMGDFIIFYVSDSLYVYDIFHHECLDCEYDGDQKICFEDAVSTVAGLECYASVMATEAYLFHTGLNDLSLVWHSNDRAHIIYCIRFKIKRINKSEWRAAVYARNVFNVPKELILDDCVQAVHN